MAVKIKLSDALQMHEAIGRLPDNVYGKVLYWFGRIDTVLLRELKDYEGTRNKKARAISVQDPDTGQLKIPETKTQEFADELNDLLGEEIEITFQPIKAEDLMRCEPSKLCVPEKDRPVIRPEILAVLDPFLVHPEELPITSV